MGEDELARLEALTEAATPGPWYVKRNVEIFYVARDVARADIAVNAEFIAAARAAVPALIAELRRLRDEREALVATLEAGFASGRCPRCDPHFDRGELSAHDADCPFRDWRASGVDVAALTANHKAVKAETAVFLAQWEAEHPERAAELRKRASHP